MRRRSRAALGSWLLALGKSKLERDEKGKMGPTRIWFSGVTDLGAETKNQEPRAKSRLFDASLPCSLNSNRND
jgi:hypothetical protein